MLARLAEWRVRIEKPETEQPAPEPEPEPPVPRPPVPDYCPGLGHLPIIQPPYNGVLWKTPNHDGNGTVVLFPVSYLRAYRAGHFAALVVSSDPAGQNIVGGRYGTGRIVPPWGNHPAVRFDVLGTHFRPGPVYFVLIWADGNRQPWFLPDPGARTGAL